MLLTSPLFGASQFYPTSPASTTAAAAPRPNAPVGLEEIALHLFQLLYSAPLSLATLVRAGLLNDEAALLRYREEAAGSAIGLAPFAGHSAAAEGAARAAPERDPGPGSAAAIASPPPPPHAPPLSPPSLPILRPPAAAPTTRPPSFAGSPTAAPPLQPDAVARRLAALYREHPLYELRDVLHREATRLGYANYQDPASNDIVATAEALRQREMLVTAYTQLALMAHQQPGTPVSSFPTLDAVLAAAAASASTTSAAAAMQDPEVATWAHGLHQLLGCHHQRERHCPHRGPDGQQRGTERLVAARAGDAAVALEVAVGRDQPRGRATTTYAPAAAASASPSKRTRLRQRALTRGEASVALRFVQQLQGSRPIALTRRRERPQPPPRTSDGEQLGNVEMRARHGALNAASLPPPPNVPPTAAAAVPPSTAAAALTSLDCMNGLATEDDNGVAATAPRRRLALPAAAAVAAPVKANASGGFDPATPARLTATLPDSVTPVAAARPATPHSPDSPRSSRSSTSTSTSSSSSSVSLSVVGEDEEEDEDAAFLHGDATDEDDGDDTHAHAGPHGGAGGSAGQPGAPTAIAATGGAAAAAAADPFANRTVARLTAAVLAASSTSHRSTATPTAAAGAPVLGFQSPGNPLLARYTDTRPFAITELAPSSAADLLRLPYYAHAHEMNRLAVERGRSCYQDPHTGCLVFTSLFLSRLPHCYGEACAHCPHGEGCQRMQRHLVYSTGGGGGVGAEERVGGGSGPQEAPRSRTRHARRQRGRRGWVAELSGSGGGGGRDCGSDASSSDADDPDTLRVLAELDAEDGLGPLSTPRPSSNGLLLAAELASTPPQRSGGRRIDGAGAGGGGVRRGRDQHVEVRSPASATSSVSAASFSDDDDEDDNDEAEQQQRSLLLRSAALSMYPSTATRNTAGLVVQVNSLRELLAWGGAGAGGGSPRPHARQQRRHASRQHVHHDRDRRPLVGSCGAAERDGGAAARVTEVEPDWVDADADVEELLRRHEASLERFTYLDYAAL